jgi:hypothetical protein
MTKASYWSLVACVGLLSPLMPAQADQPVIRFPTTAATGSATPPPAALATRPSEPSAAATTLPAPAAEPRRPELREPVRAAPPVVEGTEAPPVIGEEPAPPRTPQQKAALDAATQWDRAVAGQPSTAAPATPPPGRIWPQVVDVWPRPPSAEAPVVGRPAFGAMAPAPPPTVLYGGGRPPGYPPAPPPAYPPAPPPGYPDYGR